MEEAVVGNWIGLNTIFYNLKTGKTSSDITEVIDFNNFEIDYKGLAAYLDFGYCAFGRTPIKDVRFLLPYQELRFEQGKASVVDGKDNTLDYLSVESNEEDVLGMLEEDLNNWANRQNLPILIPTSGGFDSRLLNVLLKDKTEVHTYTYGTSQDQSASQEVVYAEELGKRLGTKWERIDLGEFNSFQEDWYTLFGSSVAANGTYHMEFFNKIRLIESQQPLPMLSGLIGDAWAGAVSVGEILNADQYNNLGYTHGMNADSKLALNVNYLDLKEELFEKQKPLLQDANYRLITAMRTKMMLLKSLITIPNYYGFQAYSPFVDEKIAMSMLMLPKERRKNRVWQRDFFRSKNVLFEEERFSYTYQNSLNYYALTHFSLAPLNVSVLREVISQPYLDWINRKLMNINFSQRFYQTLLHTPKVKGVMKLLGFKNDLIKAYFAYSTLKPIEKLLEQRNNYGRSL